MKRHVFVFGFAGGLLITLLQFTEYRFLVIEHSFEIYGAIIAMVFAALGVWLGLRITRRREVAGVSEPLALTGELVPAQASAEQSFSPNTTTRQSTGITARELDILALVARGYSNREIAAQLFVAESTVKTHCARVFGKLGAARRTQAVLRGKELGLLP